MRCFMKKLLKPALLIFIFALGFFYYFNYIRTVGSGTIPIITYHSIRDDNEEANEYVVSCEKFDDMVRSLSESNFTFLDLKDVEDIVYGRKALPENPVMITLDDGYADNYTNVFPILKKYKVKASIFIIGSYVGRQGFLTFDQIQEMAESGLVDFGSHTYNLHDLFQDGANKGKTWLSVKREDESREDYLKKITDDLIWNNTVIYERTSVFPTAISYPGAMVNDDVKKAAKDAGLKIGFVGADKTASKVGNLDPYEIKRFNMRDTTDIKNTVRFLKSSRDN